MSDDSADDYDSEFEMGRKGTHDSKGSKKKFTTSKKSKTVEEM
jgi:hypothetical protein